MAVYCFDIDGTICTNTEGDYEQAEPFPEVIDRVNHLYKAGHTIIFYTARGATTGIDWADFTRRQLEGWRVKFHEVHLGKPFANYYIDDRAINSAEWLEKYQDGAL